MIDVLNRLSSEMKALGINYQFGRWQGKIRYPYFVGDCDTADFVAEHGYQEATCYINGFTRGELLDLLQASEKIKRHFADFRAITESGSGVSITFAASSFMPQEEAELKRIQITLNIKKWSVENESR